VLSRYVRRVPVITTEKLTMRFPRVIALDDLSIEVPSAVSLRVALSCLAAVFVGSTWYAGRRLRSLTLASDQ